MCVCVCNNEKKVVSNVKLIPIFNSHKLIKLVLRFFSRKHSPCSWIGLFSYARKSELSHLNCACQWPPISMCRPSCIVSTPSACSSTGYHLYICWIMLFLAWLNCYDMTTTPLLFFPLSNKLRTIFYRMFHAMAITT